MKAERIKINRNTKCFSHISVDHVHIWVGTAHLVDHWSRTCCSAYSTCADKTDRVQHSSSAWRQLQAPLQYRGLLVCVAGESGWGGGNCGLRALYHMPPISIKLYWDPTTVTCLHVVHGCFYIPVAELRNCHRDHIVPKSQILIFWLLEKCKKANPRSRRSV